MTDLLKKLQPLSRKALLRSSAISLGLCLAGLSTSVSAQSASNTNRVMNLAEDSPFRDENLVYLEADDLASEDEAGVLTIIGDVEGRYEDRTLRADKVIYDRQTARLMASGNVTLIEGNGSVQYADRLELSDALETGTATNYTGLNFIMLILQPAPSVKTRIRRKHRLGGCARNASNKTARRGQFGIMMPS